MAMGPKHVVSEVSEEYLENKKQSVATAGIRLIFIYIYCYTLICNYFLFAWD
jgi:hypothetical protein